MPSRLRPVLRALRMILACVVLGVLSPSPVSPAQAEVTAAACFASLEDLASGSAGARATPGTRARAGGLDARAPTAGAATGDRAVRRPAGSRALIVASRLYLRHASLLC